MFLVLFLNSICLSQEKYISECFNIWFSGQKVSLSWNSELLFIPEILKIKTSITEITKNNGENTQEALIYVGKNSNTHCEEDYLQIPNFMREETSLIHIKIDVLFIDYIIDHFEFYLNQDFKLRGYHNYLGFNNALGISLEFSKNAKTFKKHGLEGVAWTPTSQEIKIQKRTCVKIMNIQGDHIFQIDNDILKSEEHIVNKFNLLRVFSYSDTKMTQQASHVDYIIEIYECDKTVTSSPINIFVDNKIKVIEIQFLPERRNEILYKMKLERQEEVFVSVISPGYNSKLFDVEVIEEMVEIALYKRKDGLLQFKQRKITKICKIDQKEIEFDVIIYNESTYILTSRIKLTSPEENVSYYRYASYKEKEKCLSQII